jgi:hypothetical protein
MRFSLMVVRFAAVVVALRAVVAMPSKGAVVAGIGPLGMALRHAGTPRGRVLAIAVVSALLVLGGVAMLFA